MKIFHPILISMALIMTSLIGLSQDELILKGALKDAETLKKLDDCQIIVFQNGTQYDVFDTGSSGKYEFRLPLGYNYDIKYTKQTYVTKIIRIDTRNIPEEDRAGGFQLDLPGVLFRFIEGFNLDIMKEPVGKVSFSSQENAMDFDIPYADRMREKIEAEIERIENLANKSDEMKAQFDKLIKEGDLKMGEKKYQAAMEKFDAARKLITTEAIAKQKYDEAKAAFDAEQAAAGLEAKYQKLLSDGDVAIKAKKWEDAKKLFTDAKNMKPAERLPKDKLDEIYNLMKNEGAMKEYEAIIAQADTKFNSKDYAIAIEKYTEASKLMPNIMYPKEQINKAQKELDGMLANAALEANYNRLLTEGDAAIKVQNWEEAKKKFQDAKALKPNEQLPKDKLEEIAELQKNAGKQAQFDAIIAIADTKFNAKDYQIAIDKYKEASAILPNNPYPKDQIAKAQAAIDSASAANSALEASYQKAIKDGDLAIKDKKWDDAIAKFNEAKGLKPSEKLPQQKLSEITELMKNAAKQAEYDAAIADADAKFNANDYKNAIEKYKQASNIIPSIAYPKDQIGKALAALDLALSEEAKKKALEQRYSDLVKVGTKNISEKKYDSALNNFKDAQELKPEEQLPKDKIKEIEELLAEIERNKQKADQDALANKEKEERERQFNTLIQEADKLYAEKSWPESKAKYEEALVVKDAQYPRARIASIEEILLQEEKSKDDLAEANRLKEEERKRQEEEQRLAREEQERLAEEARLRRMEDEEARRKAQEEELARNAANNKSGFRNGANRDKEDEVEAYYREARALEDSAKYAQMRDRAENNQNFIESRNKRSEDRIGAQREKIDAKKEGQLNMNSKGNSYISMSTAEAENKKEEDSKNKNDYIDRSENRIERSKEVASQQKEAQEGIVQNDRNRQKLVTELEDKEKTYADNNATYESRSGALRTDATMEADRQKENQTNMAFAGENVRKENETEATEKKEEASSKMNDLQSAANVRLETTTSKIQRQKESSEDLSNSDRNKTDDAMMAISEKKQQSEMLQIQKENQAAENRYEKRKEIFDVNTGSDKTNSPTPGAENIPEGVTEKSYKLNNQIITERTVKQNGKVNTYLKSVSKTGIYYFKNGKPITKQMWIQETLEKSDNG